MALRRIDRRVDWLGFDGVLEDQERDDAAYQATMICCRELLCRSAPTHVKSGLSPDPGVLPDDGLQFDEGSAADRHINVLGRGLPNALQYRL